jgi:hypothetical protein
MGFVKEENGFGICTALTRLYQLGEGGCGSGGSFNPLVAFWSWRPPKCFPIQLLESPPE